MNFLNQIFASTLCLVLSSMTQAIPLPSTDLQSLVTNLQERSKSYFNENQRPLERGVPLIEAQRRTASVSAVSYHLELDLVTALDRNEFVATTTLKFNYKKPNESWPLTIDLYKAEIKNIEINGQNSEIEYNGFFISLPLSSLNKGENTVKVHYSNNYNQSASMPVGLHRVIDADDKETYLYSQFEVDFAHHVFPCFDQPDLKARISMDVEVFDHWQVISTIDAESQNATKSQHIVWSFPETPFDLSTYTMSLHAGPFQKWDGGLYKNRVPLRLFARKSKAEVIAPLIDEWFSVTRSGLNYFEKRLGVDYPYTKYDQLTINEFYFGAMENIGAVTFNEDLTLSSLAYPEGSAEDISLKTRLFGVVLHEMSHMWFGNLVTAKWWNDVWLHESFATYYAKKALEESLPHSTYSQISKATPNERSVINLGTDTRSEHPISHDLIFSSSDALPFFDSITYEKGGAVLAQLETKLGRTLFDKSISSYLKMNSFKNTDSDRFFQIFSDSSRQDLSRWKNEWLKTAGYNKVLAEVTCDEHRETIVNYEVIQKMGEGPLFREHWTSVEHVFLEEQTQSRRLFLLGYDGPNTPIESMKGQRCPDLIILNYADGDYVQSLYPRSDSQLFDDYFENGEKGALQKNMFSTMVNYWL